MNAGRLRGILERLPACRVAVLGDFFLDKYLDTDPGLAEISVETGKTAHQVVSIRTSPGAAGTIVNNLASLGAGEIHVLGITGDDGEGYDLRKALHGLGCRTEGLLAVPGRMTPTYLKPRNLRTPDLSGEHERYDTKNRTATPRQAEDEIIARLEGLLAGLDAVAVEDQVEEEDCGVVTARVRERLTEWGRLHPGKVFWADSRSRISLFRNVMIKVNAREALKQAFRPGEEEPEDAAVARAVSRLRARTGRPVFVTAGRRGIWTSDPEPQLVRAVRVPEPTDPTGAGDSATAGAVLALCAGATAVEAALVANLVASITVQQLATTGTARPEELVPRLEMWLSQG
ncbi:MAG TPA: PfkB family carbohydrate kinase [Burkholderiales bacterium]|nr:PfkB family carbohydrate kinase [Burkholderiales bacterium]